MLKKLLYLYNDGHNPFPNMKGQGFGPVPDPNHPGRENYEWFPDDTMTQEEADRLNGILPQQAEESMRQQREETEITHPMRYAPTVPTKEEYLEREARKAYEAEFNNTIEDYEDEMDTLNKEIGYNQSQEVKMLKDDTLESLKKTNDLLEKEEKAEKKKIIINNLQKTKILDDIKYNCDIIGKEALAKAVKNNQKIAIVVNGALTKITNNIVDIIKSSSDVEDKIKEIEREIVSLSKIAKIDYDKAIYTYYSYIELFKKENKSNEKVINKMQELLRTFKPFEKYQLQLIKHDTENKITEERLKEITERKKKLGFRITYIESGREENKPLKLKYHELKQQEKAREDKVVSEIEKIKKLKESNPEQAKAEATELRDELVKQVEKLKQSKPVKKSEEEKQIELTKADVVGRLTHVTDSISPYGKDLEHYLSSPNGSIILKYITNDNSTVHDNEYNKNIPDIMVTLDNGKKESLRKAVTLDLYSDKNVFEIKNYKQYSFTDDIIPLQETKLEGTYYFKPLYLKNGNLYNIELTYTDETGEHKKYILPENKEGRELVLIYRLKDGLYQYKPLIGDDVTLQLTTNKTKDKKPLYVFESSIYDKCIDHHGKPSFNIKPFLRKIKI